MGRSEPLRDPVPPRNLARTLPTNSYQPNKALLGETPHLGLAASSSFQRERTCPSPCSCTTIDLASSTDLAITRNRSPALSSIQIRPTNSLKGRSSSLLTL